MKVKSMVLKSLMMYGCVMNFNADDAGGDVGGGGHSTGSGGSDNDLGVNNDSGDAGGDTGSGDDSGDDSGGDAGDGSGDGADGSDTDTGGSSTGGDDSPDPVDLKSIDDRLAKLLDAIDNKSDTTDSGDDGDKGDDSLEHSDLVAMMADDPDNFLKVLTDAVTKSVKKDVEAATADREYNRSVEKTIDEYADSNKDFEKMWDSGDIQKYIEENPGHNAISAHMAMTMENRITEAKKQGAEEALKNYSVKASNQVLNGGVGIPPNKHDDALKNPSKYGGPAAVIAARAKIT